MKRVGLLLSGCGRYDGTEVHEAVLAVLSLDRRGARIEFLAPGEARADVVDHGSGQLVEGETRSALAEAARIARGRITPLAEASAALLAALIIPGGQGTARTLMSGVGRMGVKREADPQAASLVKEMLAQRKPVGAISLGGALVSTILDLPLEEDPFSMPSSEVRIDEEHGIVWTPGFLSGDRISEIAQGIDRLVDEVLSRATAGLTVLP